MVKKTYSKTVLRMFKSNFIRFAIIVGLVGISIALNTGIGALEPRMNKAVNVWRAQGIPDHVYFIQLTDKIKVLSFVFSAFFIAVVLLVVFITMKRLIESERGYVGCYKTLGYGKRHIIWKYTFFSFAATAAGCLSGLVIGRFCILPVLFSIISKEFNLPETTAGFPTIGFAAALITILLVLLTTLILSYNAAKEKPNLLMIQKAPKPGRKILLERIPFFWNKLPFRYKSTLRNIFRYKLRFTMTVLCETGATALVFTGLSLYFALTNTNRDLLGTIIPISIVLIISAILMNALVIYNITNINIEERKTEIAALRVLGYRKKEVCGYIFRELFLLTSFGTLIGLPAGYLFMKVLIESMKFGNIKDVKWYVWFLTAFLSLISLALTDLLLFRKINKVNMNRSLNTATN